MEEEFITSEEYNRYKFKELAIRWIFFACILLVIVIIFSVPKIINKKHTLCIASNSVVYVRSGCLACDTQKSSFGSGYQDLNIIDCFDEPQKCLDANITSVPTWIISDIQYSGIMPIIKLRELTGC